MYNAALHYLTHFDALHQFKISDVLIICIVLNAVRALQFANY